VGLVEIATPFVLPDVVVVDLDEVDGAPDGVEGVGLVGLPGAGGVASAAAGTVATVAHSKAPANAAAVKVAMVFFTADLPKS
jgi:hypothetical protein